MLLSFTLIPLVVKSQTFYSRGNGNWDAAGTWSTVSHAGGAAASAPTDGSTVIIGDNDAVTYRSGNPATRSIASLTINDDGDGGTLTFGNGTNQTNLTVTGNVTINSGGTLRSGATGGNTHRIRIRGNLINNGTLDMTLNSATNQYIVFEGSALSTISGSGTYNFRHLTLETTGANNVNVESNIAIYGTLNFAEDGLLVVADPDINITLGNTATVTGYTIGDNDRYIQLNDSTGANGQLIRLTNNSTTPWRMIYPVGTSSGGFTPLDMSAANGTTMTTAPTSGASLAIKPIFNNSIQGQLRRTFRLTVSGNNNGTTFANARFYYDDPTDISGGDAESNYDKLWYLNTTSTTVAWTSVNGSVTTASDYFTPSTSTSLGNGTYYFTIGSATAYPNTWYSYQTGVWSNWENWTLDPSGTTLVNGLNLPPLPGDEIVILNGAIITNDTDGQVATSTTIRAGGTLDMAATTGNNLGAVSGAGLLRIEGISLPTGTYTSFVTANTGGTVEYYNTGGTLPTGQTTYNNLLLSNNTGSAITYTTANNLTVNGDFDITQTAGGGTVTWMINNGTGNRRTITLNGNLEVSANGRIRASNSGATGPHLLSIYGDLTNDGSIKFFDDTDAQFNADADYTGGSVYTAGTKTNAVNVTFAATEDQTVTCNNTTDFYRFIVNKGTGQQSKLTVNSSNTAYFRLWGPANLFSTNSVSNCALSIVNGTLELTGSITIPRLIVDGSAGVPNDVFGIPQNGALWLNSPNVNVTLTDNDTGNDDQRLTVNGLFRVSNGSTFNSGFSRGIGSTDGGTIWVEGDNTTMNIWQYRPVSGGSGIFAYIQTGGTVNVGTKGHNGTPVLSGVSDGVGGVTDQFARFSLAESASSFTMSGGTLNIGTPTTPTVAGANVPLAGGLDIQCANGNYNVSGGTINMYIPATGTINFSAYSTAPLFNVNIYREGTTTTRSAVLNSALTVLNDLKIITGNSPTLNCSGHNLTVGGDIEVQSNTTLTPGANTITLNGTDAQTWTNSGTISGLNNIVVSKTPGSTLTLAGANGFPNTGSISGLTLTSGTLNDGGKILTVTTTLSNSAVHTGSGKIVHNATGDSDIGGANGIFGNLDVNTSAIVTTKGNQTVTGTLRMRGANTILDIGSYNLMALGGIYTNGATGVDFSETRMILTAGLRNDQGLSRQAVSGIDLLFPVGTEGLYTPATINVTATTAGKITVTPVVGVHPNATPVNESLLYYWTVTSTGFAGISAVTHKDYDYFSTALLIGTTDFYKPARYDPLTFVWATGTTYDADGLTTIPNFSFGTNIDGEYTTGNLNAGALTAYYSKVDGGSWGTASSWSNDAGRVGTSSSIPCGTCPVLIGDGATFNHTINISANNTTSGSLQIASGSTLNCGTFTGLNFGVNLGETVSGTGTLRINVASQQFPAGDFKDFIGPNGGTVEWYGTNTTAYVIPDVASAPQELALDTYYNLIINPNTNQTIALPAGLDLKVYNNFTKTGAGTGLTNTGARALTVEGDLIVNDGIFSIRGGTGNTSTFVVNGNTTVASGGAFQAQSTGSTHTFTTTGNITNNGTLDFRNTGVVNLTFTGTSNTSLSGTASAPNATRLNNVILDKGDSQSPTLTVDVNGASMNTLTTGWLTLINGTIDFNNSATYSLSTSTTAPYSIPTTARLKVRAGTMNIIGNVNDNDGDLSLSGTLEVAGGTVNINPEANNRDINNDIEYAAAGTPTIIVSSGALYVNGAIRRSLTTLSGALVYQQSGGTVTVGGRNCDANDERGVFEIESNTGSEFIFSGGTLSVRRSTGGTAFADLYINPATSLVSPGSTIEFGMGTNTAVTAALSLNIVPAIGNLSILGTGTAQTVDMRSSELTTLGTLTINTNSTLETNALDVNIGGNLSITGEYDGTINGGNTTTFNGTGAQTGDLATGSTFHNITVDKPSGVATLNGTTTINNLNILNGELSVSGTLNINGDIVNNSTQTGAGTITIAGTSATHTITSADGSFTNLSFGGTATTKKVTLSGGLTINGVLNFTTSGTSRYFFIGESQLTFSQTGSVTNANKDRFIRTNGVSSDLGVVRNWTTGSNTFTYHIGTRTNYTPVTFNLNVSTAGNLAVIPVDDQHPTANPMGEQILNYYWIVKRGTTLAYTATGTHSYTFPTSLIGGANGTLVAAHLDAITLDGWTRSPGNGGGFAVAGDNTIMTFTNLLNSNLPVTTDGEFHYTAGTVNTLPNPIQPVYSRFADADQVSNPTSVGNLSTGGNWNLATNWTISSTGYGDPQSVVPNGRPVVILSGARINMNIAGLRAFTARINGLLVVGTKTGHSLGAISGTGTMQSSTSTLPAGNYTNFVSSAGGTIQYLGTINMNSRSTYNNLRISSGTVTMTSTDLALAGSVIIDADGVLNNTVNNKNITLAGDWSNSGTFNRGTGTTVTFNGANNQTITGSNTFNNVTINKTAGNVTLGQTVTVNNVLTLTNGYVVSSAANPLVMATTATVSGGGYSSFVTGPMIKNLLSGGSFAFPLGSFLNNNYRPATISNSSATDTWTAEYIGEDPTNGGYSNQVFNTTYLQKVSEFEYWNLSRAGGTSADVTLFYDAGSYLPPDIGIVANLRVVHWDGSQWDHPPGGDSFSQSGTNTTGTVTVTNVTSFSPFTFGSPDLSSPLPVKLKYFNARLANDQVDLTWETALEINNDYFTIEKSVDLETFEEVGRVEGSGTTQEPRQYSTIDPNPYYGRSYYRLKQTDFNGQVSYSNLEVVDYAGPEFASLRAYPNPTEGRSVTIEINGLKETKSVLVEIIDVHGHKLITRTYTVETPGHLKEELIFERTLSPGLYIIKAGSTLQLTKKIVVE